MTELNGEHLASENPGFSLCAAPFDSQAGLISEEREAEIRKTEFGQKSDGGDLE